MAVAKRRLQAPLATPNPLGADATRDIITAELEALLADTFALYLKTKS